MRPSPYDGQSLPAQPLQLRTRAMPQTTPPPQRAASGAPHMLRYAEELKGPARHASLPETKERCVCVACGVHARRACQVVHERRIFFPLKIFVRVWVAVGTHIPRTCKGPTLANCTYAFTYIVEFSLSFDYIRLLAVPEELLQLLRLTFRAKWRPQRVPRSATSAFSRRWAKGVTAPCLR